MKITAIKAQVKNPDRVSVYVDEKYALSLSYNQLLDQKIHAGSEVSESQVAELKKASDFGKAYERALIYVMIRPRSEREVQNYGWRKKWSPEDTAAILKKLVEKGYVSDRMFAKSWVESRAMHKNMSKRKLVLELKQKGITDDIVADALATGTYSQDTALKDLIEKKRRLSRYKDDQKLMQYLARQGFGFDDIKQAIAAD